jgi:hypothetical protein
MRSKADWPPEVAGVLDLLESQPPEAAMLVGCFLAAVAHPDHAAELAMFDKLPSAARMVVGRFGRCRARKAAFAHAGLVCPSAPFAVNGRTHPLGACRT